MMEFFGKNLIMYWNLKQMTDHVRLVLRRSLDVENSFFDDFIKQLKERFTNHK